MSTFGCDPDAVDVVCSFCDVMFAYIFFQSDVIFAWYTRDVDAGQYTMARSPSARRSTHVQHME